jgi:hypothetical protein
MKIVRPVVITEDNIVSINTTEVHSPWSILTVYDIGDVAYFETFVYRSLTSGNTGNQPDISSDDWLKTGPTNAWACFDGTVSTRSTVSSGPLEIKISVPTATNSLSLLNMDNATSVRVIMKDMTPTTPVVVYDKVHNLGSSTITDWYEYFFSEFNLASDLFINDLPPYINSEIEVRLNSSGQVGLGVLLLGNAVNIGNTKMGLNYGIRDYSIKEMDEFGETLFVERNFSKRMSANVFVENIRLNSVSRLLSSIRATPTVFVGSEASELSQTINYGFLKDWNVELTYPSNSIISMEVEGLI